MKIRSIIETSVFVALALALKILCDNIPFLNMLEGGTIDLCMLPLILIGLRNGLKYSLVGLTLYVTLSWMIGGFKIYSMEYPVLEVLLDRYIPYIVGYSIPTLFIKKKENRLIISLSIILAFLFRLVCHTLSGALIFYTFDNIKGFFTVLYASLLYNVLYLGFTTLICLCLFNTCFKILYFKKD